MNQPDQVKFQTFIIVGKDMQCRTPDSPESARAVAPKSPISPRTHHSSLGPPRSVRNGSSSPVINGMKDENNIHSFNSSNSRLFDRLNYPTASFIGNGSARINASISTRPEPGIIEVAQIPGRIGAICSGHKCRCWRSCPIINSVVGCKFMFDTKDQSSVCSTIVLIAIFLSRSPQSGGLTAEDFKQAIQEAANFPLRPYVLPFLKSHIPLMQRDIASLAKSNNQVSIFENSLPTICRSTM